MTPKSTPGWRGYRLGVLAAAHELCAWGEPTYAKELIAGLLQGESVPYLKRIASAEGMQITEWPE